MVVGRWSSSLGLRQGGDDVVITDEMMYAVRVPFKGDTYGQLAIDVSTAWSTQSSAKPLAVDLEIERFTDGTPRDMCAGDCVKMCS